MKILLFFLQEYSSHVWIQEIFPDSFLSLLEDVCRHFDSNLTAPTATSRSRNGKSTSWIGNNKTVNNELINLGSKSRIWCLTYDNFLANISPAGCYYQSIAHSFVSADGHLEYWRSLCPLPSRVQRCLLRWCRLSTWSRKI